MALSPHNCLPCHYSVVTFKKVNSFPSLLPGPVIELTQLIVVLMIESSSDRLPFPRN